jgi:hypothetical protein
MAAVFVHHLRGFSLRNTTRLDTLRLLRRFGEAMSDWPVEGLRVWVRASRGADYSGTCYPREGRIYVNFSPRLIFPYRLHVQVARGRTVRGVWRRSLHALQVPGAEELVTFVFLHECCHWLIHKARRNGRCKEAVCDRFAARYLVESCGCVLRDGDDQPADLPPTWPARLKPLARQPLTCNGSQK